MTIPLMGWMTIIHTHTHTLGQSFSAINPTKSDKSFKSHENPLKIPWKWWFSPLKSHFSSLSNLAPARPSAQLHALAAGAHGLELHRSCALAKTTTGLILVWSIFVVHNHRLTGWRFGTFFCFPYIGKNHPN